MMFAEHGYRVSDNKQQLDLEMIHRFLASSYWSPGIAKETVERAIHHSFSFGLFNPAGEQIGFARVVSDTVNVGYVADVFVLEPYRRDGLGGWFMEQVLGHPAFRSVARMILTTADAHGFYHKLGFEPLATPELMMERKQAVETL